MKEVRADALPLFDWCVRLYWASVRTLYTDAFTEYLYRKNGRGLASFAGDESGVMEKLCSFSSDVCPSAKVLPFLSLVVYWFGCFDLFIILSNRIWRSELKRRSGVSREQTLNWPLEPATTVERSFIQWPQREFSDWPSVNVSTRVLVNLGEPSTNINSHILHRIWTLPCPEQPRPFRTLPRLGPVRLRLFLPLFLETTTICDVGERGTHVRP